MNDDGARNVTASGYGASAGNDGAGHEPVFPGSLRDVIFAQFGVQAKRTGAGEHFIAQLRTIFGLENGPVLVERCHHTDSAGFHEDILLAYWLDKATYDRWIAAPAVAAWWQGLPEDGECGYWREVLSPDIGRFGFIGFGLERERRVGCTHALASKPTGRSGYWGGYRDRFSASTHDTLATGAPDPTSPRHHTPTVWRRLKIFPPENLCFVREGQETTYVTNAREKELLNTKLRPAFARWIQHLKMDTAINGAVCMRDTVEQDLETGADKKKFSTFVYLMSLRHLERAARTQPSHLALYNSKMSVEEELAAGGIKSEFVIWAEAHVLPHGKADFEYINCHELTGLIPYFPEKSEVDAPRDLSLSGVHPHVALG